MPSLAAVPVAGTWWRATKLLHAASPLATAHTRTTSGRFNPGSTTHPSIEILYLTEDHLVAQFEVEAVLGSPLSGHSFVPNPAAIGWSFLPMAVNLRAVADLTAGGELKKLDTSIQELTGDWLGYDVRLPPVPPLARPYWSNVPTQRLGVRLEKARTFEGLLSHSARDPRKRNLIVFPNRLRPGSFVAYTDPATGTTIQIP